MYAGGSLLQIGGAQQQMPHAGFCDDPGTPLDMSAQQNNAGTGAFSPQNLCLLDRRGMQQTAAQPTLAKILTMLPLNSEQL